MLPQARHEFHQIARFLPAVELGFQYLVPAVAACAGRSGQSEQIGAARETAGGARLHRRGADRFITKLTE